jgi:hypothetical protein
MSEKAFCNELQRAQARPDVADLFLDLEDYYRFNREVMGGETHEPVKGGNHNAVMDAHRDDPQRGLAYLALAMARYDDRDFLGVLSAGLLENLLGDPAPVMLHRIIAEARKTPRFRWLLSGVWLHAIAERARVPVEQAVGDWRLEQPLPPAPF